VWGDGSSIRDFIYSSDVARGMMLLIEKKINEPINLGSGKKVTIKKIVETIVKYLPRKINIEWDISKPSGDKIRLMDINKLKKIGFTAEIDIDTGIKQTLDWYKQYFNYRKKNNRYNSFLEKL
jgi:GDP-L-fucose synthase